MEHLILLRASSKDLLPPFVPTLPGNFLLLLEMEYLVEPQLDTVLVQNLQVTDSAANVKVLEMLVSLDSQFFVCVVSCNLFPHLQNWKIGLKIILFSVRRQQLSHNYSCHL